MPLAASVSAFERNASQSSGGSTPALSKVSTLYQTVDLLTPLKKTPYSSPSTLPAVSQPSA